MTAAYCSSHAAVSDFSNDTAAKAAPLWCCRSHQVAAVSLANSFAR